MRITLRCKHCDKSFKAKQKRKYCSDKCNKAAYYRRNHMMEDNTTINTSNRYNSIMIEIKTLEQLLAAIKDHPKETIELMRKNKRLRDMLKQHIEDTAGTSKW